MSNAERQARYHQRRLGRLARCVAPDDVFEAVRLMYQLAAVENGTPDAQSDWEDWLQYVRTGKGRRQWFNMLPESSNPDDYLIEGSDLSPSDRSLLARVAAVVHAMREPPPADTKA